MRWLIFALLLVSAFDRPAAAPAFDPTHAGWNRLLQAHVHWNEAGTASSVDYSGFARDSFALDEYLRSLSVVPRARFEQWNQTVRQAFLINAYNAATVQLVLTRYPNLESIKDIGGWLSSPWKQRFVSLFGQTLSLDQIEHDSLRGDPGYADPRLHFALNCASVGCPALRPEAYSGGRLHEQLQDQTSRFLRDRSRNRYDERAGELRVSKIFEWYSVDFERHAGGVAVFLADYADALGLDAAAVPRLRAGQVPLAYRDYDWALNRSYP